MVKTWGGLQILVNNAGITRDNLILRMKDDQWDAVLAINLSGTFLFTRAAARPMIKGHRGRIINIASVSGLMGNPGQANYSASKAGVIGLTRTVARELAGRNITVNAVAPGFIATDMTAALGEEVLAKVKKRDPPGPAGRAPGRGRRGAVPGQRRGQLHHRPCPDGRRGHDRVVAARMVVTDGLRGAFQEMRPGRYGHAGRKLVISFWIAGNR